MHPSISHSQREIKEPSAASQTGPANSDKKLCESRDAVDELESLMTLAKDVLQSPAAQSDVQQKQVNACMGLIDATWERARTVLTLKQTPRSDPASREEIEKMFSEFKELTKQRPDHTPGVADSSALTGTSGKVLARILRQQEMKACVGLSDMLRQEIMAQETDSPNESVSQSEARNGRVVAMAIGQEQVKACVKLADLMHEMVAGNTTLKDAGEQTDQASDKAVVFQKTVTELEKLNDELSIQQSKAVCSVLCEDDVSTNDSIEAAKKVTEKRSIKCIGRRLGRQEIRASTILCDMLHGVVNRQRSSDQGGKAMGVSDEAKVFCNAFGRLEQLASQHAAITSVYETQD